MLEGIKVTTKRTRIANFYGDVGWSTGCDCGQSLSYSPTCFIVFYVQLLVFYVKYDFFISGANSFLLEWLYYNVHLS